MPEEEVLQRAKLALAQAKKIEREARYMKQMLGGLLEHLQIQGSQGEENGSNRQQTEQK